MKPKEEEEEPRGGRTTTKSVPMPTGPASQHWSSNGLGVQRNDATSTEETRVADEKPPDVPDVEMGAEDFVIVDKLQAHFCENLKNTFQIHFF